MQPSSRTPEGDDNTCPICGHRVCIEPSRPPGDATCPYCGSLLWFVDNEFDSEKVRRAAMLLARAQNAIDSDHLAAAAQHLRRALSLDPHNKIFAERLAAVEAKRAQKPPRKRNRRQPHRTS